MRCEIPKQNLTNALRPGGCFRQWGCEGARPGGVCEILLENLTSHNLTIGRPGAACETVRCEIPKELIPPLPVTNLLGKGDVEAPGQEL